MFSKQLRFAQYHFDTCIILFILVAACWRVTLSVAKSSEHSSLVESLLVTDRTMPALLLRLLLQCAGDIEMKPGSVATPTPTNSLCLIQWNVKGISGEITELLTFLNSNNVNIAAIQETKLTNKTKPHKTPG